VISARPKPDQQGLVYDWRLALPLLMKMISMRLFVLGAVDPNFRTDHVFDIEIDSMREALKTHYTNLSDGLVCTSKDYGYASRISPVVTYYGCNIVCADIYTGISAIKTITPDRSQVTTWTDARCSALQSSQPTTYRNAVNDTEAAVRSKLPLFQLKSLIDLLYTFRYPASEFTQLQHRITSDPASNLCVDVQWGSTANGTPLQLWPCNGTPAQQWTYDRRTGQLRNGLGTCMDQRFSVYPGSVVGTWACDTPQGDPPQITNQAQMWTYDPLTGTLLNALGTTLMASSLTQGAPLWNESQGAGFASSLLTHHNGDLAWRADQVLPSSQCGTLLAGQGLNPGQKLTSCDGRFALAMQADGTLALFQYVSGGATQLWSKSFGGLDGGAFAAMQGDGNFVVYGNFVVNPGPSATAVWATATPGYPGAWLAVQDDGNLVLYDATSTWRWQSGTPGH
jgi:Ricin-type beta-trefoil lectin domain